MLCKDKTFCELTHYKNSIAVKNGYATANI